MTYMSFLSDGSLEARQPPSTSEARGEPPPPPDPLAQIPVETRQTLSFLCEPHEDLRDK